MSFYFFFFFFFFFFKQKTAYEIMPSLVGSEMCIRDSVTSHLPPGFNEYDFVPESFDRDKTIALIMNSSGSTGLPKGVALPHRTACVRFSHARDPIFGNQIIPDTAILSVVPFHHGFGMFTTLGYLICGFRVVLMYRFEEELFLRSLQDYKIQSSLLVPTLFSFFAKSTLIDKYDLSNLHEIASGGAPLSKEVGEAVAKRFHLPGIRQGYGLTETTSAILITPEGDDKPGAVGKVVPFFEAKVVDLDTGKTLGVNQRGELCVRGPMIMSGYVNNPEATNALIDKDGWLHSGDIAYWDEDEHFFIVDRLKSLIKYKGYQVAPAELESILLQHPNIFDAGVAGLPDDDAGELPAAVVVLEHGKRDRGLRRQSSNNREKVARRSCVCGRSTERSYRKTRRKKNQRDPHKGQEGRKVKIVKCNCIQR